MSKHNHHEMKEQHPDWKYCPICGKKLPLSKAEADKVEAEKIAKRLVESNHRTKVNCWIGYCRHNSLNVPSLQGMFYCTLDEIKIEAYDKNKPECQSFEHL
jgi:hypothetical protein